MPADVWCAVGLYHDSDAAKTALQLREQFMPFLANTVESWHAQLMPVAHKCECNHFDRDHPGEWIGKAHGCLASQMFTPHTVGDDGFTMSIWRDDASMLGTAYRPGFHRSQIDRHKAESVFDRSSFTRFRVMDSCGLWNGRNPVQG